MNTLVDPFLYDPLKHLYKLLTNKEYRDFSVLKSRYKNTPRFKKINLNINGNQKLTVPDMPSFLSMYEEIFIKKIYQFIPKNKINIVDMGANIGLSVLFFLKYYPQAKIEAFEADKKIYDILISNIPSNDNISLVNQAVWNENMILNFFSEGGDGGRIQSENLHKKDTNIKVKTIDALDIMEKYSSIDFLKIDIEGAEKVVLPRIKKSLYKVDNIFLEYHCEKNKKQCLRELIDILEDADFRIMIQSEFVSSRPFFESIYNGEYDMQLNIFGKKGWNKHVE